MVEGVVRLTYHRPQEHFVHTNIYAVSYKLFWEYLRYMQLQFSALRLSFSLCSCSCPIFPGILLNMRLQPAKKLGVIYFMKLQLWRFSELISHMFLGGWYRHPQKHYIPKKKKTKIGEPARHQNLPHIHQSPAKVVTSTRGEFW